MNITPRYLTKSRFKLALECPTKLYYTSKSKEYKNTRNDDPFLAALADGGFQVEELARLAYPEGVLIQAASGAYDEAVAETEALLKQENCVIFEAAFRYENLFIRTDILVKKGNVIELIEVKAKSFLLSDWPAGPFLGKRGGIETSWKPYLFDIAFQTYVLQNACPQFEVRPFMQLIDKSKKAQVNNLNQCVRISKNGDKRKDTIRLVNSLAEIGGENLMTQIDVSGIVFGILSGRYFYNTELTRNFEDLVQDFSKAYETDQKINAPVQFTACKSCEFKNFDTDGLKSGYHECWKEKMNWGNREFSKPNLLEVWNFKKGGALLRDHKVVLMEDLTKEMHPLSLDPHKITSSERQWLQIEKALANDDSNYVDRENLKAEIQEWEFPLHFIDFE
jgi:CRISPR/Cas system-associated exonuclease Cas4 (RecB family)